MESWKEKCCATEETNSYFIKISPFSFLLSPFKTRKYANNPINILLG